MEYIKLLLVLLAFGGVFAFTAFRLAKTGFTRALPDLSALAGAGRETSTLILILCVFLMFAWVLWMLFTQEVPQGNKEILISFATVISTAFGTIIGWRFGSSKSSSDKDKTIADIAKTE